MRFFIKFVVICNGCFILSVILRYIELSKRIKGDMNGAISYQPLESTVVVLGYGAILVNSLFFLISLFYLFSGKIKIIADWMLLFNLIMLILQMYYFFFS